METVRYENFEQTLLGEGRYVTSLHGTSMYPMVRDVKDPVMIVPLTEPLRRYDVAVYTRPDRFVVHRVLERREDCYVIRGDNCVAKEYVPLRNVVGVVSGFWRCGRYVPVSNPLYRVYARFWVFINPLVRAHHFLKRAFRFVLKSVLKSVLKFTRKRLRPAGSRTK